MKGVLKAVLQTGLNVYRESSRGSRFVTHSHLVLYKWSQTRSTSCNNLNFPLNNFYQNMPIPFQNNIHCWWIETKKSPKYKLTDNTGVCQKQPFDIIAMTPRWTLGLCCVHIDQLMTHPAVYTLPFTLQLCYNPVGILQRVTKSQKSWCITKITHMWRWGTPQNYLLAFIDKLWKTQKIRILKK